MSDWVMTPQRGLLETSGSRLTRRSLLGSGLRAGLGIGVSSLGAGRLSAQTASPAASGHWNLSGKPPYLIVHYLPWFVVTNSEGKRVWDHWKNDDPHARHDPENRLANGRRDIASVCYPLIGPYSTGSENVLRCHMETIRAMGGDAVILDWYAEGHPTDQHVPAILDAAHKAGVKVAICYEEKINFIWPERRHPKTRAEAVNYAIKDLNYALRRYASHPAYLRRDGKPFFTQFNGWGQGEMGPKFFTPDEFKTIFAGLTEPICYGRQGLDAAYDNVADCRYLWIGHNAEGIRKFGLDARRMVDDGKAKFFMASVAPGFDDTGVWGWGGGPRVSPRKGLSFLYGSVQNMLAGSPELVQAVTWNDFQEGSVFEPTRDWGYWYVDALATWWAQKTGRPAPNLDAIRVPFRRYAASATPEERAELPPSSEWDACLARRPLTVEDPAYLDGKPV